MKQALLTLGFVASLALAAPAPKKVPGTFFAPVVQTGVRDATEDKPQSKVWYAAGRWWAWLPAAEGGGRVWRRIGPGQWQPERHLDYLLGTLPGRADVWTGGGQVVAALMEGRRLAVASLRWHDGCGRYEPDVAPRQWEAASPVETVTLDRDADGTFWVAYPVAAKKGRQVVARRLPRSLRWPPGGPIVLADGIGGDEICGFAAFGRAVGVMWSDQKRQSLFFRRHVLTGPDVAWQPVETVAAGNQTADDHINFCVPPTGQGVKLLAVTKTSLDKVGEPIFSLRVLDTADRWRSVGFGTLTKDRDLTRPIVLWSSDRPVCAYTCRSPYRKPRRGSPPPYSVIETHAFGPDGFAPAGEPRVLIRAKAEINNVTGPKAHPPGIPAVVLASDADGGVYEGVIAPPAEPEGRR